MGWKKVYSAERQGFKIGYNIYEFLKVFRGNENIQITQGRYAGKQMQVCPYKLETYNTIMFLKLFLLFVTVPIIELWLLIDIGRIIGTFQTVGLIIITGLAGAFFAKTQGLITLYKIRENLINGVMPSSELLDGLLILLAGGLLITPGLLTDALSFILLIPQTRIYIKKYLLRKFKDWMQSQRTDVRFYTDSDEWE